jgi:hypothetical protein
LDGELNFNNVLKSKIFIQNPGSFLALMKFNSAQRYAGLQFRSRVVENFFEAGPAWRSPGRSFSIDGRMAGQVG